MSVYQTQKWTWARAIASSMLGALIARPAGALFTTPTIILITDNNPITPDDAVANHTVANFSGYTQQAITFGGPGNVPGPGLAEVGTVLFVATTASPFVTNQITGYLLGDGVSAFYGGEQFAAPIPIAGPEDFISLTVLAGMGLQHTMT